MERISEIWFSEGRIYMRSSEGKIYSRPLEAFPMLKDATDKQREAYTIEMRGEALRWRELDEDIHISSFFETTEPNGNNEIATMFKRFPQLNIAEFARTIGINKALLDKFIYGMRIPTAKRREQIERALHELELSEIEN